MMVRVPRGWDISERAVTPEEVYRGRRRFLQGAGAAMAGLGVAGVGMKWWLYMLTPEPASAQNLHLQRSLLMLQGWFNLDIKREDYPHARRWYDALTKRPAYQKHIMITMS